MQEVSHRGVVAKNLLPNRLVIKILRFFFEMYANFSEPSLCLSVASLPFVSSRMAFKTMLRMTGFVLSCMLTCLLPLSGRHFVVARHNQNDISRSAIMNLLKSESQKSI